MHYYLFNIGDYKSHTDYLTLLEDLAYRRLLDLYYLHEKPIIEDLDKLSRLIGMVDNKKEIENVLNDFFELSEKVWINKRADKIICEYKKQIKQASKAGKASAKARKANKAKASKQVTTVERPLNDRCVSVEPNNKHKTLNTKQETVNNNKEIYVEQAQRCLDYLNRVTGRSFKKSPDLIARVKEYDLEEIKLVIDYKSKEWMGGDMQKYLRPQTLFNNSKFEGYLNDANQEVPHERQQQHNQQSDRQQVSAAFNDFEELRNF